MILSMTGFARKETSDTWGTLSLEIKAVNHRYLETWFRLPDSLRMAEIPLRERIKKKLSRGKVEVQVRFSPQTQTSNQLNVNTQLVHDLNQAIEQIKTIIPQSSNVNPLNILQWPGVVAEQALDPEQLQAELFKLLDNALDDLLAHRAREGTELAQAIEERLQLISAIVSEVRARLPEIIEEQRANLKTKVGELIEQVDPQRLEQEIVMLAQKIDVAEELDRLDAHVQETRHVLTQKGSVGRRLDFLMQEFNREANTLSSKSILAETTKKAVDLKVYIEQMREQIQNIE
ncbi:YicC/YloC family endoribonuclease [Gynuella sp.]|uniref:YicC/YloC family endoribonuclease n=1 Tax=Gynuella sp. TaxID=2969146 RepID=UPI003D0BD6C0